MSNPGLVVLVDGRRMISTGVGIALVVAGAILRFAVPATFTYGLNTHVVSVIVMLVGVFGLLLSLLVWGPLGRRHHGPHHDDGTRRYCTPRCPSATTDRTGHWSTRSSGTSRTPSNPAGRSLS